MKFKSSLLAIAAATALAGPTVAEAQLSLMSSFLGSTGGGLGAQATVLTIGSPGSSTAATGCVGLTGTTLEACGFANSQVQTGASQTQLVQSSQFSGLTANNFRIVLNALEPGGSANSITVDDLVVTFYGANGATFSGELASAVTLDAVGTGAGNFGYAFGFAPGTTSYTGLQTFLNANSTYQIGLGAGVSNATGGFETFSIALDQNVGSNVVPEPSTYALMGTGLLALGFFARRRRQA